MLGQGAREHAIIKALIRTGSPRHDIIAAPGNAGIAADVRTAAIDPNSPDAVTDFAQRENIDLVVIGPEAPLVAGVSDALRAAGIAVFGPSKQAAQLEGSKTFAKQVMAAAGVPTGMARQCTTIEEVALAIDEFGAPYVVKADGLAAGKGVIVTSDRTAALEHARKFIDMGVLVEEFLDGQEVSLFFLSDGETVVPLSPAQDFKRAFDGDAGPNTGGMGAYSPLPWLPTGFVEEVERTVALPTISELAKLGAPFVGLLYCGLIVTKRGIRVIEFNARFGDPETQVVLRRLITPLDDLLHKAATGQLREAPPAEFSEDVAITVVLASEGYPDSSAPNREITGLQAAETDQHIEIAHAATRLDGDTLLATGGRVLSVVAMAKDFHKAREHAYAAISKIHLQGSHYRSDIAKKVELPGWHHIYSGKVRDLYESDDPKLSHLLLVVASDRVSAFDHVLRPAIPNKGKHLTALTNWWFDRLDVVNHVSHDAKVPKQVEGRATVAKKLNMFPIECVVRGYISGSGWKEYQATGEICGVKLPKGLTFGAKLPQPIFTPAFKADLGEHDENITFERVVELIGVEDAAALRNLSLEIFAQASELAERAGLILADTKFEFGRDPKTGEITLGDEVLTPDSSRYWSKSAWERGERNDSFDKQIVRNWLAANWDQAPGTTPPAIPQEIVEQTAAKYAELVERLSTGIK